MLYIHDTLSRSKVLFKPVEAGRVRMYVCGMTVYDYCHLGHARMLVGFDVVQRWLRASGLQVEYVRNITDIDDKIIQRAKQRHCSLGEITSFFIDAMHADERALGVQSPDQEPCATRYIGDMVGIIARLIDQGLAYQAPDGDVNFSVRAFPGYGKLSGKSVDDLRAGERVAVGSAKRDPLDFVLWKAAKAHEPNDSKWESPYGTGRPGWHIECSAMSQQLLGLPLDIHGGGPDLKFPHHENEIAQTEGAFGGTLARVWMHCGPLMVDVDKMSKSLNNFRTIREMIALGELDPSQADYAANPREAEMLRFFMVRTHYRSPQHYTQANLVDAQNALDRLYQALANVQVDTQVPVDWQEPHAQAFKAAMDDDFNTPAAMAVLFQLATELNKTQDMQMAGQLKALGDVLGLLQHDPKVYLHTVSRYKTEATTAAPSGEVLDEAMIETLIETRAHAKRARNFAEADHIRTVLRQANIEVEDKPGNITHWRRI